MNFIEQKIKGVWVIEPKVFNDARGYFFEAFKKDEFEKHVKHKPARLYQLNKTLFGRKNVVNFSTIARIINI